jgi:hypothetical protein
MKKFLLSLCVAGVLAAGFSSCALGRSMKRDCQGGKHVKLKNGIYI